MPRVTAECDSMCREQVALTSGAVRKGLLEEGEGSEYPGEGDMVCLFSLTASEGLLLQVPQSLAPQFSFLFIKGTREDKAF